jgi:hypothetical protein
MWLRMTSSCGVINFTITHSLNVPNFLASWSNVAIAYNTYFLSGENFQATDTLTQPQPDSSKKTVHSYMHSLSCYRQKDCTADLQTYTTWPHTSLHCSAIEHYKSHVSFFIGISFAWIRSVWILNGYRHFGEACRRKEASVNIYPSARCRIPEDLELHRHCSQNHKSCILLKVEVKVTPMTGLLRHRGKAEV